MYSTSQNKLIEYFKNAVSEGSLRQCYILSSPSGYGKKYILNKIKQYVICDTNSACGRCSACMSVQSGANPDCVTISNGDKKIIEVDKIRTLIKEAYIRPVGGKYKIFVIENAHLMQENAQNALLKIIEEPPLYAVFLLVSDNINTTLPTILSRSTRLTLDSWSYDNLKAAYPLDADDEYMYTYCLGNIGMLESIASDEEFRNVRDELIAKTVNMILGDEAALYEMVDFWIANKDNRDMLINILSMFIRDVMLCKSGVQMRIANKDKTKEIQAVSSKISLKASFNMLTLVSEAPQKLGKYGNYGMFVQTLMIRLREEIYD